MESIYSDLISAIENLSPIEFFLLSLICGISLWLILLSIEFLVCGLCRDRLVCFNRFVPFVRRIFIKLGFDWENYVRLKKQAADERGTYSCVPCLGTGFLSAVCSCFYFRICLCKDFFFFNMELAMVRVRQSISKNALYLGRNNFEVTYTINSKLYKFRVKPLRGPSCVPIKVYSSERTRDCSARVLPYAGPCRDWHGLVYTPDFWEEVGLEIEIEDHVFYYGQHDTIPSLKTLTDDVKEQQKIKDQEEQRRIEIREGEVELLPI